MHSATMHNGPQQLMCWSQQVLNGSSSAAAAPSAAAREAEGVDYSTWPVKELRRFLTERGINASGIVEKADLVAQVNVPALCHDPFGCQHVRYLNAAV